MLPLRMTSGAASRARREGELSLGPLGSSGRFHPNNNNDPGTRIVPSGTVGVLSEHRPETPIFLF